MEIKKKIGSIDLEEWLKRKKVLPDDKIIEDRKYSRKLIAYLDILGIRDLVCNNIDGDEYKVIDKIEKMRKIAETTSKLLMNDEFFDFLHISDSFVFVSEPNVLEDLLVILASIQMRIILECHYLLRGAVTIGDAITREQGRYIIGPAYIKAFELQDQNAIYPRIIIDNNVLNEVRKSPDFEKFIYVDKDKESFLDYISIYKDNEELRTDEIKISLQQEGVLEYIQGNYEKYNEEEDYNIKQKYGWTIQYFKELGVWKDAK